ncbi:MAG: hypothetical protein BRC29_05270 [Nanohaloarchaea archaeon SW_7_43_1]|nr:MAG: hypothetical protein BRC29_05270 [Nanohaloarchaea archaeon SW_7_43_1]
MGKTEQRYDLGVWEYDLLIDYFVDSEEVLDHDEENKELRAVTERNGSDVYFQVECDEDTTWFSVFSYNEGEELEEECLERMAERRLRMVYGD